MTLQSECCERNTEKWHWKRSLNSATLYDIARLPWRNALNTHTHLWHRWFSSAPAQDTACLNRYSLHSVRSKHRSAQESSSLTKLGVWSLQRHREKERVGGYRAVCTVRWCYWMSLSPLIPHWRKTETGKLFALCVLTCKYAPHVAQVSMV